MLGIEWASMLSDFGLGVTIMEYADRILPNEDRDISKEMQRILKKKKVKVIVNAKVLPETIQKMNGSTAISAIVKGEEQTFAAEKILVSVGRRPNTENLGLQNTDIELDNGFIKVNKNYQTKESHIYAIGDVIGGLQLAHVASYEGIKAVEHITRQDPSPIQYKDVPRCVYSNPEIASVGLTEEEAKELGHQVKTGNVSFKAIGKALVYGDTDGFVKIIADVKTNDILGIHIIGPHATDMISEAGLARILDATPWEVANSIHPHPSLSEAIGEAALAVDGQAIHS